MKKKKRERGEHLERVKKESKSEENERVEEGKREVR